MYACGEEDRRNVYKFLASTHLTSRASSPSRVHISRLISRLVKNTKKISAELLIFLILFFATQRALQLSSSRKCRWSKREGTICDFVLDMYTTQLNTAEKNIQNVCLAPAWGNLLCDQVCVVFGVRNISCGRFNEVGPLCAKSALLLDRSRTVLVCVARLADDCFARSLALYTF